MHVKILLYHKNNGQINGSYTDFDEMTIRYDGATELNKAKYNVIIKHLLKVLYFQQTTCLHIFMDATFSTNFVQYLFRLVNTTNKTII